MHLALRELRQWLASQRFWATIALVVLVFTVTGPFGTRETMPVLQRFAFWALLHTMAFSIALLCSLGMDAALSGVVPHKLPRMLLGSAVAALPIGMGVCLLQAGFTGEPITFGEFAEQASVSLPLCLLLCLLSYLVLSPTHEPLANPLEASTSLPLDVSQPLAAPDIDAAIDDEGAPIPLLVRLKPETRGRLMRMSSQDHYTEVVTTRGRELILLRFSDAMREAGPVAGMQVHRSHWVSDENVASLEKRNGRLALLTKDGAEIPVSRANEAAVSKRYRK